MLQFNIYITNLVLVLVLQLQLQLQLQFNISITINLTVDLGLYRRLPCLTLIFIIQPISYSVKTV